jgi:prepilin-type N-terminal cleavage/methylation domain-containing protein
MGFTLIELMVVIVIIGVLASLAIPRFTEASDKAKFAEVPRVLATFESAVMAAAAEIADATTLDSSNLIFSAPDSSSSKWFTYANTGTGNNLKCEATPQAKIGDIAVTNKPSAKVNVDDTDKNVTGFTREISGDTNNKLKKKYGGAYFN